MADQPQGHLTRDFSHDAVDAAEKGMHDNSAQHTVPGLSYSSPERLDRNNTQLTVLSQVHSGITPNPSKPDLSLSWPAASPAVRRESINATALKTEVPKKSTPTKTKVPRWILADLWFNTYRKFFTFIILLNLTGIILTALGRFPYADNHLGALVLGNLLSAILFRNELWMRFLYLVAIYGLRGVSTNCVKIERFLTQCLLVGAFARQVCGYICPTACRRYPFGMRVVWRCVSDC
jgi:hypothetical protein